MSKRSVLALLILIFIAVFAMLYLFGENSVNIYNDGENVSVETNTLEDIDTKGMNQALCDYTVEVMNDTETDMDTYKLGLNDICSQYGLDNVKITVDSSIGPDQIPVMVQVDGTSMLPTLKDGQSVLVNKTHNVHVGDIVVAESDEYGGIIKRVADIQGDSIYLVSDNKNVSYEYINGVLYEIKGITTWVDISDINGVVISY